MNLKLKNNKNHQSHPPLQKPKGSTLFFSFQICENLLRLNSQLSLLQNYSTKIYLNLKIIKNYAKLIKW